MSRSSSAPATSAETCPTSTAVWQKPIFPKNWWVGITGVKPSPSFFFVGRDSQRLYNSSTGKSTARSGCAIGDCVPELSPNIGKHIGKCHSPRRALRESRHLGLNVSGRKRKEGRDIFPWSRTSVLKVERPYPRIKRSTIAKAWFRRLQEANGKTACPLARLIIFLLADSYCSSVWRYR